jgi:hypothetical protein
MKQSLDWQHSMQSLIIYIKSRPLKQDGKLFSLFYRPLKPISWLIIRGSAESLAFGADAVKTELCNRHDQNAQQIAAPIFLRQFLL